MISSRESEVAVVATAGVGVAILVRALKVWSAKPAAPDPWGMEIANSLEEPDAMPICLHCQCPHEVTEWLCPQCGRAVGEYTNLMAPFYAYSVGDVLTSGIDNGSKLGPIRTAGSIGIAAAAYLGAIPFFVSKAFPFSWLRVVGFPVGFVLWAVGIGLFVTYIRLLFKVGADSKETPPSSTDAPLTTQ